MANPDASQASPERRTGQRLGWALLAVLVGLFVWRAGARVALSTRHQPTREPGRTAFTAVDARGVRVALDRAPQRIVSLTPANTEILFALGLGHRIVADTTYCDYPPEARALPHVGDSAVSIERVLAQRPDLIVASASANGKALSGLARTSVPVLAVDPHDFAQTLVAIEDIGRVTGQSVEAAQLVRGMRNEADLVAAQVARTPDRPRVLIVLQADPLWVAGSGNFMDEMVTRAGGLNATRNVGAGYQALSPERVVGLRPDVILAPQQDVGRLRGKAGWSSLPAIRRNALYSPDPNLLNRPGPRLPQGLAELARILHPTLARHP